MLFIATSLVFLALDNRSALEPVKSGVHGLLMPAIDLLNGNDPSPPSNDLQGQYDALDDRYKALEAENAKLQLEVQEVDQLRALLDLRKQQPNLTFVSARVLYPDPSGLEKFVIIDKGSADGIREGMAVTDPNFFVGLVTRVEETKSRVSLAIDAKQSVGAQLLDGGAVGIAWGMWQRGQRMELRHVDRSVTPPEGAVVVTACRSEATTAQVPCGLVIGKVSGPPVTNNQGDMQTIPIVPVADFDNLSVVAVIVADTGSAASPTADTAPAGAGTPSPQGSDGTDGG